MNCCCALPRVELEQIKISHLISSELHLLTYVLCSGIQKQNRIANIATLISSFSRNNELGDTKQTLICTISNDSSNKHQRMSTCALGGPGGSSSSVTTLVLSALSFVVTQRSNARSTKVLLGLIQSLFCNNFQSSFKWLNTLTPWRPALINWRHNPERSKPKSANLHVCVISTLKFSSKTM